MGVVGHRYAKYRDTRHRRFSPWRPRRQGVQHPSAESALTEAVLDGDHQPVSGGVVQHLLVEWADAPRVPHGGVDAVGGQLVGRGQSGGQHLPGAQQAHLTVPGTNPAGGQTPSHLVPAHVGGRRLGPADGHRAVGDGHRVLEHLLQLLVGGRGQHRHPRHPGQQHHVQHPVVRGAVVTGDTRPVQAEHDREAVEADVQVGLIEGPAQERGVQGDHRAKAAHGHAGCRGHRVLLCDAHVEAAVGETVAERKEARGIGHRRGDGHHLRVGLGGLEERFGERLGVAAGFHTTRVVHVLDRILFGRGVAPTLLGQHVDHDRSVELGRVGQGVLDLGDVVAVERAQVVDAERLEERRRFEHVAQRGLGGADAPLDQLAHPRQAFGQVLEVALSAHVGRVGTDPDEALRQAPDRGGVGPPVVVEHHGHRQAAVTEVVETLEGHAAGHRAITDHRHDPPAVAGSGPCRGQAVGVRQHGRRVGVLDPVVGRFISGRIARHLSGLAQSVELGDPSGQEFVDVGLVPGVEEDGVPWAIENPVESQGELHGAQVRTKVAAGAVHGVDDALAQFPGQGGEFLGIEVAEVGGGPQGIEAHDGKRYRGPAGPVQRGWFSWRSTGGGVGPRSEPARWPAVSRHPGPPVRQRRPTRSGCR